jgi:dTDP-4-amino-4,6-dideoxygalactose transaminase
MSTTTIDLPKSKYELEFNQGSVYEQEERDAVLRVLAANAPSCGSEVLAFEKEFSNFVGATFGIAVGNATQGLELAVRAALSLSRNEVVVPAVSWISTASAAALAGAVVRFADVAAPSVCVDVEAVKRLCNEKTAAVIVVHLYGRPVDGVLELAEWLKSRHIALIEDCAHSVGATIRGRQTGSVGDIGVFSFHQQKNMVTLGEGGLVVTSSPELREKMVGFRSLNAKR